MGVNNRLALANSALVRDYAAVDPRLRALAYLVKHWARERKVNDPYRGTLSSYAYVLMIINFLQTREPPVLPCLQRPGHTPVHTRSLSRSRCLLVSPSPLLSSAPHGTTPRPGQPAPDLSRLRPLHRAFWTALIAATSRRNATATSAPPTTRPWRSYW